MDDEDAISQSRAANRAALAWWAGRGDPKTKRKKGRKGRSRRKRRRRRAWQQAAARWAGRGATVLVALKKTLQPSRVPKFCPVLREALHDNAIMRRRVATEREPRPHAHLLVPSTLATISNPASLGSFSTLGHQIVGI